MAESMKNVNITLKAKKKLEEIAKETEENSGFDLPTARAKKTQEILKNSNTILTLQERKELEEIAEKNSGFFYLPTTAEAKEAQSILDKNVIIYEETQKSMDNQFKISTKDIGKGTLKEQGKTLEKNEEINAQQQEIIENRENRE